MRYQHRVTDGHALELPLGKVVCIGRNYADHALELNNPIPKEPILFIKPATSVVPMEQPFSVPAGKGEVHFETEMAILIGETLKNADEQQAMHAIAGIGLGLDMTLREVQSRLKEKGQPWEKSKCFDGACPLSTFLSPASVNDLTDVQIRLSVNGEVRQDGNSAQMLTPVLKLLAHASEWFTLEPGDVVLTGTPAGVGPVQPGDQLRVELVDLLRVDTAVQD
ncbi:fumarylacetoacetate hydrolase family protein [Marinobacterium weihaiense]|uniref:Fumarylacetoacetate hydrolase family protein n=1 Tax=Marinobacterium weihaiense TaxID=2851016 RepID=A0ABS6MDC7_9GAMM|nr:fumarylacetoacetate hydrolase family protein [Marinobacterium weihaiense]MBV0934306.1 fumarylacetoacetate hydrolase family protein [Marinobacterium weihaiense]